MKAHKSGRPGTLSRRLTGKPLTGKPLTAGTPVVVRFDGEHRRNWPQLPGTVLEVRRRGPWQPHRSVRVRLEPPPPSWPARLWFSRDELTPV